MNKPDQKRINRYKKEIFGLPANANANLMEKELFKMFGIEFRDITADEQMWAFLDNVLKDREKKETWKKTTIISGEKNV